MTAWIVTDASGNAVSVGSRLADPLPDGYAAVKLTAAEHIGLTDASLRWDQPTRKVVVNQARVAELRAADNEQALKPLLGQALAGLQQIIDGPATMTAANLTAAVKAEARVLRRLVRLTAGLLDSLD